MKIWSSSTIVFGRAPEALFHLVLARVGPVRLLILRHFSLGGFRYHLAGLSLGHIFFASPFARPPRRVSRVVFWPRLMPGRGVSPTVGFAIRLTACSIGLMVRLAARATSSPPDPHAVPAN
jgi:hypothetical protein